MLVFVNDYKILPQSFVFSVMIENEHFIKFLVYG